ncbi:MAG: CYTH domain-containing protein [Deltaproteobacteria bacterium]|nr:CYTH domain-containing protein [Deltaproteobacteria bacterium]
MKTRGDKPFEPTLPALTAIQPLAASKPVPWVENGEIVSMPPLVLHPSAPREDAATGSYLQVIGIRGDAGANKREKEIKLALDGVDEMSRLAGVLGECVKELQQFNLFYEDPGEAWRRAKFSVRFRLENGALELTIKGKGTRKDGVSDVIEESMPVDASLWPALSKGHAGVPQLVRQLLEDRKLSLPEGLSPDDLVVLGGFTNTRRVHRLPGDALHQVELDCSVFPNGVVSYEAEMELKTESRARAERAFSRLEAAFAQAHVDWRPSNLPKMARLRAALKGTDPE